MTKKECQLRHMFCATENSSALLCEKHPSGYCAMERDRGRYYAAIHVPNWHTRFSGFSIRKVGPIQWVFVCEWQAYDRFVMSQTEAMRMGWQCLCQSVIYRFGLLPKERHHPGLPSCFGCTDDCTKGTSKNR